MFGTGQSYEPLHTGKKIIGPSCSFYFIQPANSLNFLWAGTKETNWTPIKQENLKTKRSLGKLELKEA